MIGVASFDRVVASFWHPDIEYLRLPPLTDDLVANAGIAVVFSGVRMPRMNAVMERWVRNCRRELLDRTLIFNQRHLLQALREYEVFYNEHRPHQGIANARPLTLPWVDLGSREVARAGPAAPRLACHD
jgi:transposase InsO family protein